MKKDTNFYTTYGRYSSDYRFMNGRKQRNDYDWWKPIIKLTLLKDDEAEE